MIDPVYLEGVISVRAALRAGSRDIQALYVRIGTAEGPVRHLLHLARLANIPTYTVPADEIESRAGGGSHGGVIAEVGTRRFLPLESLLSAPTAPLIVMLDGVEDPFNFGAAVRSLYAAGVDGLVVRPRNWMSAAGIVARASAGASELIPTAIAETAADAAAFFRAQGLLIACTTDEAPSCSLFQTDLTRPLFVLIGGEKRGITRSFLTQADLRLRIPYARTDAHSLGTAAAAAVLAFEAQRQRTL